MLIILDCLGSFNVITEVLGGEKEAGESEEKISW